jgi:hypothetical protein
MPMGVQKVTLTNKSSLLKHIKLLKNKGFSIAQIADETGLSISYVKKLSAQAGKRRTVIQEVLEKLQENPYVDLNNFKLTDSQKTMIYQSDKWLSEIKPLRVMMEMRNNIKLKVNKKFISSLNPKTLKKLESHPAWPELLKAREEFEEFKKFLRQFRTDQKEKVHIICTPYGIVSLEEELEKLKAKKGSIPDDKKYPMAKASTKRFTVSDNVSIMHDEEYVRVCQNINVMESEILKMRVTELEAYINRLSDETKRLIDLYFRIPGSSGQEKWYDRLASYDIDDFFNQFDEELPSKREAENYLHEEMLEQENRKFIACTA